MQCKQCQARVNVLDRTCPSCGASQSILDKGPRPQVRSGNSMINAANRNLEDELARAEKELMGMEGVSTGPPISPPEPGKRRPPSNGGAWKLSRLAPPSARNLVEAQPLAWDTSPEEVQQIAQFVFHSAHVQANPLYQHRAGQTTLRYLPDVGVVNAFATDQAMEGLNAEPPFIAILGGLVRVMQLAACGLSLRDQQGQEVLVRVMQALGRRIVERAGEFSSQDSREIAAHMGWDENGVSGETIRQTRSYAAAMMMNVIAHELGHISLGHTLGKQLNNEISRNQEREADSFASSVASVSPFSDYSVAGGIFWWVILTWVEAAAGPHPATSHPHSRERLMDYIRANYDQARDLGMDEEGIGVFLPD